MDLLVFRSPRPVSPHPCTALGNSDPANLGLRLRWVRIAHLALAGLVLIAAPAFAFSSAKSQRDLQLQNAVELMRCLPYTLAFSTEGETFVVSETHIARSGVIAVRELEFSKEGVLTFPGFSRMKRDPECDGINFLLADRIVVPHGETATVMSERYVPRASNLGRGQAPSGSSGVAYGESGAIGSPGAPGNAGAGGEHAPILVILIDDFESLQGTLVVDFRGQDGGSGGPGQIGGDGGAGARGRSPVASIYECKRPAGDGGGGGDGGVGGRGGRGGSGGVGGTVILITVEGQTDHINDHLDVRIDGGNGGLGGPPGTGGSPGRAGRGGERTPLCPGGRDGTPGSLGEEGSAGANGEPGPSGDYFLVVLEPEEFESLLEAALRNPYSK